MDKHVEERAKLELVLTEMMERGSQVLDKVYLEMMISHLSGQAGECYADMLRAPFLLPWVQRSIELINTDKQNVQLYAFALRLLALLMGNEWQFLNIMETTVCATINEQLQAETTQLRTPTVKLAHVQMMRAMIKHTVGLRWVIANKSWKLVLDYMLENQTIYVVREAMKFMNQFTHKCGSDLNDEALCTEIIAAITAPLDAAVVIHESTVRVDSDNLQRTVLPSVRTLYFLMDYCIRLEKKSCIPHILCNVSKCQLNLWRLTDMTQDEQFFKHIIGALALLNFAEYVDKLDNPDTQQLNQNQFGLHFFNHMKFCLVHRKALALLSIAKMYHVIWTSLGSRLPEELELEGNRIKFENQIISVQLTPIMFTIGKKRAEAIDAELFDTYIMKLFDISTDHTLRVCYAFRDFLQSNRAIVADMACKSIHNIISMNSLHRDRAVYVFQALAYSMKDFAYDMMEAGIGPSTSAGATSASTQAMGDCERTDKLLEMPHFLSAILTGMHAMIKEHDITWKESIESMCLMNFMLLLLNKPDVSAKISVQALKLTQLAVERFLAPNMALLMENVKDSALDILGPTIARRLHDKNWEVRDSALELLGAVGTVSVVKFPSFQQHILDHDLGTLVVDIARNDSEAFVRASALSCLGTLVQVKLLWEECLVGHDLMGDLLATVHEEDEGIVRKEYCLLIVQIYRLHRIPNQQFELIFPTMAHVAVNDLYWEAKVSALHFWHQVILRQFKYNGVIDGAFPAVTFSKKHKKIVTLTPREIESRLDLIFNELMTRGALGVLLECLTDAYDLEVVKSAANLAKCLHSFLNKYDYKKESSVSNNCAADMNLQTAAPSTAAVPTTDTNFAELSLRESQMVSDRLAARQAQQSATGSTKSTSPPPTTEPSPQQEAAEPEEASDQEMSPPQLPSDQVISSIVSQNDINLLSDPAVQTDPTERMPEPSSTAHLDPELFRRMSAVTPVEYLRRIAELDLDTLVERRGAWIRKNESFDSLLDDMMFSLRIGDANNADCY